MAKYTDDCMNCSGHLNPSCWAVSLCLWLEEFKASSVAPSNRRRKAVNVLLAGSWLYNRVLTWLLEGRTAVQSYLEPQSPLTL